MHTLGDKIFPVSGIWVRILSLAILLAAGGCAHTGNDDDPLKPYNRKVQTFSFHSIRILVLLLIAVVFAAATHAGQNQPDEIVRGYTDRVMSTVAEQKQKHGKEVTEETVRIMVELLRPVVDFPAIARAVMGKYARNASEKQKQQFTRVFKDSLLRLYLKSFMTFEIDNISVQDLPPDFDPDSGRATIRMQATDAKGKSYDLRYSMRVDDNGQWKVRNFIIEGINVGLTFMNQFDSAMARHNNDIDAVIDNWSAEMERSR